MCAVIHGVMVVTSSPGLAIGPWRRFTFGELVRYGWILKLGTCVNCLIAHMMLNVNDPSKVI